MAAFETFSDPRDGETYRFKRMKDGRMWMLDNFRYDVVGSQPADDADQSSERNSLGRLYTFDIASRVAPNGWSLPSYEDWKRLTDAYAGSWGALSNDDFDVFPMQSYGDGCYKRYSGTKACFWTSSRPQNGILNLLSKELRDHEKNSGVMIKYGYANNDRITEWSYEGAAVRYFQ